MGAKNGGQGRGKMEGRICQGIATGTKRRTSEKGQGGGRDS